MATGAPHSQQNRRVLVCFEFPEREAVRNDISELGFLEIVLFRGGGVVLVPLRLQPLYHWGKFPSHECAPHIPRIEAMLANAERENGMAVLSQFIERGDECVSSALEDDTSVTQVREHPVAKLL